MFIIAAPIGFIASLASLFIPHVELRQGIAAPRNPEESELPATASTATRPATVANASREAP